MAEDFLDQTQGFGSGRPQGWGGFLSGGATTEAVQGAPRRQIGKNQARLFNI